jgi:hypothetical protein
MPAKKKFKMIGNNIVDMYNKCSKKKIFCNFLKSRNKNQIKYFAEMATKISVQGGFYKNESTKLSW